MNRYACVLLTQQSFFVQTLLSGMDSENFGQMSKKITDRLSDFK